MQQQIDAAWEQQAPLQQQMQNDGWGVWPVVPPPYRGFSFRTLFQYNGPSLMDGVEQESNISDDPQDEWSVYSEFEEAADALINVRQVPGAHFVRAMGTSHTMRVRAEEDLSFLQFLWVISLGRFTRCIEGPEDYSTSTLFHGCLPINPLAFYIAVTQAVTRGRYAVSIGFGRPLNVCFDLPVFILLEI